MCELVYGELCFLLVIKLEISRERVRRFCAVGLFYVSERYHPAAPVISL